MIKIKQEKFKKDYKFLEKIKDDKTIIYWYK